MPGTGVLKNRWMRWAAAACFACVHTGAHAADDTYLAHGHVFAEIEDPEREADSWATCAATYDLVADIIRSEAPAMSEDMHQKANGAELAVSMALIMGDAGLREPGGNKRFGPVLKMAQLASSERPKIYRAQIMADFEAARTADRKAAADRRLMNTVRICADNVSVQQAYIDGWREMVKSGLVTLPE
jgi:hypothetical protein